MSRPATYSELVNANTAATHEWLQRVRSADSAGFFEFDLDVLGEEDEHGLSSHPQQPQLSTNCGEENKKNAALENESEHKYQPECQEELTVSRKGVLLMKKVDSIPPPPAEISTNINDKKKVRVETTILPRVIAPAPSIKAPVTLDEIAPHPCPTAAPAPQEYYCTDDPLYQPILPAPSGHIRSIPVIVQEQKPASKRGRKKKKINHNDVAVYDENSMSPKAWNECFQSLVRFKLKHGNTDVKTFTASDHKELSPEEKKALVILNVFVDLVQKEKKKMVRAKCHNEGEEMNSSILTQDRIKALDDIGFNWGGTYLPKVPFAERLKQLRVFKETFGHCYVPLSHNRGLSQFCSRVRHSMKTKNRAHAARLTVEKIEQLNEIGFEWDSKTSRLKAVIANSTRVSTK